MYLLRACYWISCAFHVLSPVNFPCAFAESTAGYLSAAIAACSINRATSAGCEMNGTWLDLISIVFALMRFAKNRWRLGFSAWSSCATMYHEGIVFHAACGTDLLNALPLIGFCVAAITLASVPGT